MVSGFRKDNKNKMEFVKDKKQLMLLVFVLVLFLFAIMNMFRQMGANSNFSANNTSEVSSSGTTDAELANMSKDADEILKKTEELKQEIQDIDENSQMVSDADVLHEENTLASREKTISIEVDNTTNKVNPFLPTESEPIVPVYEKRISTSSSTITTLPKLPPKITYPVYVTPPPIYGDGIDYQASELVSTSISGIMYDDYSPSAVIKIQGTDFLVKKGDIIKGYKVLDIGKNSVKLQYGNNIFVGRIGELLVKSDLDYTKNISNINSKFGGNTVSISVKKN